MKPIQRFSILLGLSLAILASSLDLLVVSTAMPKIITALQGEQYYTWPITIYSLTMAIAIPLLGKLSDIYGFKKIYLFGIFTFLVGSLAAAFASNIWVLIIGRAIQGIGGGVLTSNSLAAVGLLFSAAKRTKYIGILGSMGIVASVFGPNFGGWLTQNFSWRYLFLMNVPIMIITFIIIMAVKIPQIKQSKHQQIDYPGAVLLTFFSGSLILLLTWGGSQYSWENWRIISLAVISILSLICFLIVEMLSSNPILPLVYFRHSVFNITSISMLLANGMLAVILTFIPLYLRTVQHYSSQRASSFLTPMMIAMVISMLITGIVVEKTKRYKIITILGGFLSIGGLYPLTNLTVSTNSLKVLLSLVIVGIGMGDCVPTFTSLAQSDFKKEQIGTVTGSIQFFKTIGMTALPTIVMTIATNHLQNGLNNFKWQQTPAPLVKILKHAHYYLNPGFLPKILSKFPTETQRILKPIFESLSGLLSSAISLGFWLGLSSMVFMTILLIILPAKLLIDKN